MVDVQRTQIMQEKPHPGPKCRTFKNHTNAQRIPISSQLECHFLSVRQKIEETFIFLKVWEQSFEKSSSEEFLDNFINKDKQKKPEKAIISTSTPPVKAGSKVIVRPRRLSFEEQLQVRLARMVSIAKTLRHMYLKEREHRLKLFKDVELSQDHCLHIFEEMVRLYGVHYTETVNCLQIEVDTLRYERQERENILKNHNRTIGQQKESIVSLKRALQEEEEERLKVKQKLDILEKENEKLYLKALSLHEDATKSVELMEQKESLMEELKTELDEETRSRQHMEVLLDMALNKMRYLEAQPSSNAYQKLIDSSSRLDGNPFGSLSSHVDGSYLDLCSSEFDLHTSSEAHFLSDSVSSISADTALSEISLPVPDQGVKHTSSASTLAEDDHNNNSDKKRLRVPFLRFRRKSVSMDSQALLGHTDGVGAIHGSLAGSSQSFETDGLNSSHEKVNHTGSLNRIHDHHGHDNDNKIVKVKEKVRWFEKKMKVGESAPNNKKTKKLQRSSSFVYKPPSAKGSFGSLAKDIGKKLKRKRRSKTIEIPRIHLEEINSLNYLNK